MYICQALTCLDTCTRIAYTKDISTPTKGVNLMAKTLIDKDVKENIILPHALKTIHNLPSDYKDTYDENKSQWESAYHNAWNVANRYIIAHTPQNQVNAMREISDKNKWNCSGLPVNKSVPDLTLEDFKDKEHDSFKSTMEGGGYYSRSRDIFHLDSCVHFNLISQDSDGMNREEATARFNTYPSRGTFELVNHDYLKEKGVGFKNEHINSEYNRMSYSRQREYDSKIYAHEAYTKWVIDNFNDKVCIRLNVDCHHQGLAVHDLGDFNTIKQERILCDRMSSALSNLQEERQGYYNDVRGILSKIRSVEGLLESPLGKMMKPIEGQIRGAGNNTALALTPQAQFRINKLNNALDGIDDTPQEVPNVIVLHGMSGTA